MQENQERRKVLNMHNSSAPTVVIIGYGSPIRGDDSVGWHAAEQLRSQPFADPNVEIITAHQLTPELAEPISRATFVIFIDATVDAPAGTITATPIEPSPHTHLSFGHQMNPAILLTWAQLLYGKQPHAVLITVGGASFGYNEGISSPVLATMPTLFEQVHSLVAHWHTNRS